MLRSLLEGIFDWSQGHIFVAQTRCFTAELLPEINRWWNHMVKAPVLPTTTLWLCQNSYWKLPFVVVFPIKNGDFPVCYVSLPECNLTQAWLKLPVLIPGFHTHWRVVSSAFFLFCLKIPRANLLWINKTKWRFCIKSLPSGELSHNELERSTMLSMGKSTISTGSFSILCEINITKWRAS